MTRSSSLPLILEIVHMICGHLKGDKRTLSALARTCRALEEPALEVLWHRLDWFHPLVKCLPSDMWREQASRDNKAIMILDKPLTPPDCSRMLRNAIRVKQFTINGSHRIQIPLHVYTEIYTVLGDTKLLPNIRTLSYYSDTQARMSCIRMFLGPMLEEIYLSGMEKTSLVSILGDMYPSLRVFHFGWHNDPRVENHVVDIVSKSVLKWKGLRTLAISTVTYPALVELSSLSYLEYLDVSRCKFDTSTLPAANAQRGGGFPALKRLEINVDLPTDAIPLIDLLNSSHVEYLELMFRRNQSSVDWGKLFNALRNHLSHDSLETLFFSACDFVDMEGGDILQYGDLRSLLAFRNLKDLTVELAHGLYLSDSSQTKEMATCWTKMKHLGLKLIYTLRSQQKSTITLEDLIPFAVHCPDLEELSIFLDATSPPSIGQEKPGNGISQTSLVELEIGDSPAAGEAASIAAFLSSLFPALRNIVTMESREETEAEYRDEAVNQVEKVWDDTMDLLHSFAAVRHQEKCYYTNQK